MHPITRPSRRGSRVRSALASAFALAPVLALVATTACDSGGSPTGPGPIDLITNEVILSWNTAALDALVVHDEYVNPMNASRVYAMVHAAQHDALNAIDRVYTTYALDVGSMAPGDGADPVAAAASAAHGVLTALFPAQDATFDAKLASFLGSGAYDEATVHGMVIGAAAAAATLANRVNDGSDTPLVGDYVPGEGPGRYQPTPPFGIAAFPGWKVVKPFALTSPDQLRSEAHPAVTSERYATDFNEVKSVGQAGSTTRTPDQTAFAKFWYEFSEIGWNRIARVVAADRELGLQSTARLFALLNFAMADAYIAGWDSKFHYDFWRPFTAIRTGDADGNTGTIGDPDWEPAEPTPPVQDYPSTHSALGNAAAAVLASVFGDGVAFTFASTSADPPSAARSFTSFSQAADENAESRVMAGLHFRFACEAGQELGDRIGQWTVENSLRPR